MHSRQRDGFCAVFAGPPNVADALTLEALAVARTSSRAFAGWGARKSAIPGLAKADAILAEAVLMAVIRAGDSDRAVGALEAGRAVAAALDA